MVAEDFAGNASELAIELQELIDAGKTIHQVISCQKNTFVILRSA